MIVLVNPRATKSRHRRFPLSVMAIGAALPESESWCIVDGNRPDVDPFDHVHAIVTRGEGTADPVRLVAMTVMPGPQLVAAVALVKALKSAFPTLPILWGGYFPSLYPKPVIESPWVDWIVRGQGEHTMAELLDVLDGHRDPRTVKGLGFQSADGEPWIGAERPWVGPDALPSPCYERIDVEDYIHPTVLGRRSAVYQASIGCPYGCNFCGVIAAFGSRQKMEAPARTERHLRYLVSRHGIDSLHFYDNNFIVTEDHAIELAERIAPLGLTWWCEARIDAMLRLSDAAWRLLKRSGLRMIFLGAESGSDVVLEAMGKRLTTAETVEIARRTREFGIVPEFSFVLGNPADPERDLEDTLAFVRRLNAVNPAMELITYFYTPTPQRRGTYGNVDPLAGTPSALEDWTTPEWVGWMTHDDPQLSWLPDRLKRRLHDFEVVFRSRFPSVHDSATRPWGKRVGRLLARRRWRGGRYENPRLLRTVRQLAARRPPDRTAYGHLRPPT